MALIDEGLRDASAERFTPTDEVLLGLIREWDPYADRVDLSHYLPLYLGHTARAALDAVQRVQWDASVSGDYDGLSRKAIGHVTASGAPTIRLDLVARDTVKHRLALLPFDRPLFLGEEFPTFLEQLLPIGTVVYLIDALDGSTYRSTVGEGCASVICAYVVGPNGLELVGGAIAATAD